VTSAGVGGQVWRYLAGVILLLQYIFVWRTRPRVRLRRAKRNDRGLEQYSQTSSAKVSKSGSRYRNTSRNRTEDSWPPC